MSESSTSAGRHPGSGRKAEAARNDGRILDAARDVFLADPAAPVAAVAARAGVGISALYRRYPSKQEMLAELTRDGLQRFLDDLDLALADRGDPWAAYGDCLHRVQEGQSQALAQRLAGLFTPTAELTDLAVRAGTQYAALHRRTQRSGALRSDVSTADVIIVLEAISLIDLPGLPESGPRAQTRTVRVAAVRRRSLALFLQSLQAPGSDRLPGTAAKDAELTARWAPRTG